MQKKCRNTQKIPQIAEWNITKHGNEKLPNGILPNMEMKTCQN